MKKRIIIIPLIIICVLCLGVLGFLFSNTNPTQTNQNNGEVSTLQVEMGTVLVSVEAPAVAEPYIFQDIYADITGNIISSKQEGDYVTQGDILVELNPDYFLKNLTQYELLVSKETLALEKIKYEYEQAENDLKEKETLYLAKVLTEQELADVKDAFELLKLSLKQTELNVKQAKLNLETAWDDLSNTKIRAPFSGVVLKIYRKNGPVNSTTPILLLGDLSKIRFVAEIDETDISKIKVGLSSTIVSEVFGEQIFSSVVDWVSPDAEIQNNISIFKVALLLENNESKFKPGMSADIAIEICSDQGFIVPNYAVKQVRNRSYINVFEDDEIKSRRINTGADDGINVAVVSGLNEGDLVVLPMDNTQIDSASSGPGKTIIPIRIPGVGQVGQ